VIFWLRVIFLFIEDCFHSPFQASFVFVLRILFVPCAYFPLTLFFPSFALNNFVIFDVERHALFPNRQVKLKSKENDAAKREELIIWLTQ